MIPRLLDHRHARTLDLVVNGIAFGLAAALVRGFEVDGFGSAVLGALVVLLFSVIGLVTNEKK